MNALENTKKTVGNLKEALLKLKLSKEDGKIEKETGMSSTTIARINKWLTNGMGGYRLILKRIYKK